MKARRPLIFLVLLLFLPLGCQGGSSERPFFRDRFGDPHSGWGSESREAFDRGYEEGEYFIEVYEPNWFAWATPGRRFDDVVVEVDARQLSGSPTGHFGLLCRYRSSRDFYYFAITGDGYYAILRVQDGELEVLTGAGFLPTQAVQTGGEANRIRAICQEDHLTLVVNGQELDTVIDDAFSRGDVGLGVGSGPDGGIRVHFDNLVVTRPEGGEE